MADFEKQVSLIEVDVDVTQAKKDVEGLTSSILAQKDAVKANADEIKDLEKANKDLQKQVKDGTKTQEDANKEIAENKKRAFEIKKANENLRDGIKDLNKERLSAVKATKLQANSLNALRKKSADLKKQLNDQETATESGKKAFEKFAAELKDTNEQTRELDQAAGDFKTNVGNYPDAFGKARKAAFAFGGALKALGLGLIIAAIAKFSEALSENQRVADFLAKATKALGIAFNDLVNFLLDSGGKITGLFTRIKDGIQSAFSDPLETIKNLGSAIKDNLIERFNSLIDAVGFAADAIKHVFAGDFDEAIESAKQAGKEMIDVYTGAPNTFDKVSEAVVSGAAAVMDYASSTYEAASALVELDKSMELAEIKQQRLIQQNERAAEQQRQIRDDTSKNIDVRIAANEKLFAILDKQEQLEKEQVADKLKRAELLLAQDANNLEAQKEKQLALLATEEIEARIEGQRSEALVNRVALQLEADELDKERREKIAQDKKDELDKELKELEEHIAKRPAIIGAGAEVADGITQIANDKIEKKFRARNKELEKQLKSGAITEEEFAKKKAELDRKQAFEGWKVEETAAKANKAIKPVNIVSDTAASIAKTAAQLGFPAAIPFVATAGALGAVQLATVLSAPLPAPPSFAEGGIVVNGKSHTQGGEDIHVGGRLVGNMQGGEGLFVTKQEATMAMLNDYNTQAGGRSLFSGSHRFLQEGGAVDSGANGMTQTQLAEALSSMPTPVVQVQSIMAGINAEVEAQNIGTI